jgi:hypothetical protein
MAQKVLLQFVWHPNFTYTSPYNDSSGLHTEHFALRGSDSDFYPRGAGFEFRPEHRLAWQRFVVVLFSLSCQMV